MSDYKYWLDITGSERGEVNNALVLLKEAGVVPGTLVVDMTDQGYGAPFASLSTEGLLPDGTCKGWDAESHETFFHELSQKIPGLTFEFRGVCVDDVNNEMFLKAFRNGQYKEVWQDNSDLSERLPEVPWRPYGSPEKEEGFAASMKVVELICTHETRFGVDVYTSLHPTSEDALASVEDVKVACEFDPEASGEYFDYDLKEHLLDPGAFSRAVEQSIPSESSIDQKNEALRLFHELSEPAHASSVNIARAMVGITEYSGEDPLGTEDLLYAAAKKLVDCWERHQLGFGLDEYTSAFGAVLSDGAELSWCDSSLCGAWTVSEISAQACRDALLNVTPAVFNYFMALEINGQGGILDVDSEVLVPLLDAFGIDRSKALSIEAGNNRDVSRADVEEYLRKQGYPHPDQEQVEWFFAPDIINPEQALECVRNNYDICDFDRWVHLETVLGVEISFQSAMSIANALWEDNKEILEIGTPGDLLVALDLSETRQDLFPCDLTDKHDLEVLSRVLFSRREQEQTRPTFDSMIADADRKAAAANPQPDISAGREQGR